MTANVPPHLKSVTTLPCKTLTFHCTAHFWLKFELQKCFRAYSSTLS